MKLLIKSEKVILSILFLAGLVAMVYTVRSVSSFDNKKDDAPTSVCSGVIEGTLEDGTKYMMSSCSIEDSHEINQKDKV